MPVRRGCRLGDTRQAWRKIIALEEDSTTISDGAWYADTNKFWMNEKMIFPSSRHDRDGHEYSRWEDHLLDLRANFVFADGHGDFMNRRVARDPLCYEPRYDGPPLDTLPLF